MDSCVIGAKPARHLSQFSLTPVSCYYQIMSKRIPPEVLEYLRKLGKSYGSLVVAAYAVTSRIFSLQNMPL